MPPPVFNKSIMSNNPRSPTLRKRSTRGLLQKSVFVFSRRVEPILDTRVPTDYVVAPHLAAASALLGHTRRMQACEGWKASTPLVCCDR
jgi:hypothetical protein